MRRLRTAIVTSCLFGAAGFVLLICTVLARPILGAEGVRSLCALDQVVAELLTKRGLIYPENFPAVFLFGRTLPWGVVGFVVGVCRGKFKHDFLNANGVFFLALTMTGLAVAIAALILLF